MPLLPLPSSGDVGNGTPFLAIQALLRSIHPYLPDKVLLVAPIVLGGVGLYRLVRSRFGVGSAAAAYGGDAVRLQPLRRRPVPRRAHSSSSSPSGSSHGPLGPVLDLLDDRPADRASWVGAWLLGLAAIDLHVAGFYGCSWWWPGWPHCRGEGRSGAAIGLGLGVALCAYWVAAFAVRSARAAGSGTPTWRRMPPVRPGCGCSRRSPGSTGSGGMNSPAPPSGSPLLYLLLCRSSPWRWSGRSAFSPPSAIGARVSCSSLGRSSGCCSRGNVLPAHGRGFPVGLRPRDVLPDLPGAAEVPGPRRAGVRDLRRRRSRGGREARRADSPARGRGERRLWRSASRSPTPTRCCGGSGDSCISRGTRATGREPSRSWRPKGPAGCWCSPGTCTPS